MGFAEGRPALVIRQRTHNGTFPRRPQTERSHAVTSIHHPLLRAQRFFRDSAALFRIGGVPQGNPKAVAADDGFRVTDPAGRFMLVV
jgi:hypothetical protein